MRIVLALNAGSATLKFALYRAGGLQPLARGLVDHWGGDEQHLKITDADGHALFDAKIAEAGRDGAVRFLTDWIARQWPDAEVAAVGHRIVHGGAGFDGPALATPEVIDELEALTPLAPLHQPFGLTALRTAREAWPRTPQVASFDTAFHRTMPAVATRFALPREFEARGVRRYGFHGLSYAYVAGRLKALDPGLAGGRVIVAHLGAGASLCAMREGRSVETTMGFSALDGLVMATRCGSIDPGVLLHLLRAEGLSAQQLSDLLYQRSGLLGVSGISGDMRVLLASGAPAAREALALYVHRIVREVGALAAVMGGLDGLVFTGGVGENAHQIRAAVCERLAWLGFALGEQADGSGERRISAPASPPVWVIPTDEEQVIAAEALALTS